MEQVTRLDALRMWSRSQFALQADPRFSYCVHVPWDAIDRKRPVRLLATIPGTGRQCMDYRNAFADFAQANDIVVLSPLFPIGVLGDGYPDGYKYLSEKGLRYDLLLLAMIAELEGKLDVAFGRFSLFGFSGGGHFAHRFFYLHPERLASVSVGAPGGVTLIDENTDFWLGTRDLEQRFGRGVDLPEMRRVKAQLLVGADDTAEFTYPPQFAHFAEGMDKLGRNRVERNATLLRNWQDHGIDASQVVLPDTAHEGLRFVPSVQEFISELSAAG